MSGSPVCVDAGIVVRLVVDDPLSEPILRLWTEWAEDGRAIVAPGLLGYETANALHRYRHHGYLSSKAVTDALEAVLGLNITCHRGAGYHRAALQVAERFALSAAYDAHYLAVAQALGAQLYTADRRLYAKVGDTLDWVRLVQQA